MMQEPAIAPPRLRTNLKSSQDRKSSTVDIIKHTSNADKCINRALNDDRKHAVPSRIPSVLKRIIVRNRDCVGGKAIQ